MRRWVAKHRSHLLLGMLAALACGYLLPPSGLLLPVLFAFKHDFPELEPKRRFSPPFDRRWLLVGIGGVILGGLLFLAAVAINPFQALPLATNAAGAASELALDSQAAEPAPEDALQGIPVTACTAMATPDQAARSFFESIRNADYLAAWELLATNYQQNVYAGDPDRFAGSLSGLQDFELGVITMLVADQGQAFAVVQVMYPAEGISADYEVDLVDTGELCGWRVWAVRSPDS